MFNLSETCFKIKRSGCSNHKNRAINKIGEIIIYVQIFFLFSDVVLLYPWSEEKEVNSRYPLYLLCIESFIKIFHSHREIRSSWNTTAKNIYLEKWDICQIYFVFILIYTYSNYVYIKHAISIYSMTCLAIIPTLLQLAFILII